MLGCGCPMEQLSGRGRHRAGPAGMRAAAASVPPNPTRQHPVGLRGPPRSPVFYPQPPPRPPAPLTASPARRAAGGRDLQGEHTELSPAGGRGGDGTHPAAFSASRPGAEPGAATPEPRQRPTPPCPGSPQPSPGPTLSLGPSPARSPARPPRPRSRRSAAISRSPSGDLWPRYGAHNAPAARGPRPQRAGRKRGRRGGFRRARGSGKEKADGGCVSAVPVRCRAERPLRAHKKN